MVVRFKGKLPAAAGEPMMHRECCFVRKLANEDLELRLLQRIHPRGSVASPD